MRPFLFTLDKYFIKLMYGVKNSLISVRTMYKVIIVSVKVECGVSNDLDADNRHLFCQQEYHTGSHDCSENTGIARLLSLR